jgi:hypothetical protein
MERVTFARRAAGRPSESDLVLPPGAGWARARRGNADPPRRTIEPYVRCARSGFAGPPLVVIAAHSAR